MCTLIVFDRVVPGFPLVIGSNRDEYYARPSAVPARLNSQVAGGPPIVAPQDLMAGGTWMGINASGLFVGLTNCRTETPDPEARSRGQLVFDALAFHSARGARQAVNPMNKHQYNPYFLLAADGRETFLVSADGERGGEQGPKTQALEPGIHVVGNLPPGHPEAERLDWIQGQAEALSPAAGIESLFAGLREILRVHMDVSNPRRGACVHTPLFGTRSSTLAALGHESWHLHHAEGPACESKFKDLSPLLQQLRSDWPAGEAKTHRKSIRYTGNA